MRVLNDIESRLPFWVCLVASVVLITAGFILPPTGEVDNSVLIAVGALFAFASLYCVYEAIEKGMEAKVTHKDTTIVIGNDDGNDDGNDE